MRFSFLLPAFFCLTSAFAQGYDEKLSVPTWATVNETPSITLHWLPDPQATSYTIYRKNKAALSFFTLIANNIPPSTSLWTDLNIEAGKSYEYRIYEFGTGGVGYINSGVSLPVLNDRGRILLLVDTDIALTLAPELARFAADLSGDGWTVARLDIPGNWPAADVRQRIIEAYQQDPAHTKAVVLVGHVPVPYSGEINPDGHPDHVGAWPCDAYYGDVNGVWTDTLINNATASDPRNHNVPGDGKFDQSTFPSAIELQVGRIDFSNLPAFPQGEVELLRRYFQKDHDWRYAKFSLPARGAIENNFAGYTEGFAQNGWKNFSPLVSPDSMRYFDWDGLKNESYLWIYGCGGGWFQGASGITTTPQLVTDTLHAVFAMTFGSYFGDWDSQDNLLRALLASPGTVLTNAWAGRPNWQFHHMGMGETVGYGALVTQNNVGAYVAGYGGQQAHIALMGDPTLRMNIVPPPQEPLVITPVQSSIYFDFGDAPDSLVIGYQVFRRLHGDSLWVAHSDGYLSTSDYVDSCLSAGIAYDYMFKAIKFVTTPSGTYWDQSQGLVAENVSAPESPAAPEVSFTTMQTTGPLGALFKASVANVTGWTWDFGDGATAENDTAVVHSYSSGIYIVTLTGYGACGQQAVATDTVYMVSGTNEAFNASAWTLSPNPANATLAIQNRSETAVQASFRIYSAAGRLVFARPETRLAPSGLWEVPVNNWPEGLYLLHIGTSQGTTVRKFTVQR